MKSALEEQLTSLLGLAKVPGHQELIAQIGERGLLDAEGMAALRKLLLRMSTIETMIVMQRSGGMVQSVRDQEVVTIAHTVKRLVEVVRTNSNVGAFSS